MYIQFSAVDHELLFHREGSGLRHILILTTLYWIRIFCIIIIIIIIIMYCLFSVTGTWYIPPGGHPLVPPPAHQFPNALNLSNPHCDRISFRNSRHTPYPYQRRSPPGKNFRNLAFLYNTENTVATTTTAAAVTTTSQTTTTTTTT